MKKTPSDRIPNPYRRKNLVPFRVNDYEYEQLQKIAKKHGGDISKAIREKLDLRSAPKDV